MNFNGPTRRAGGDGFDDSTSGANTSSQNSDAEHSDNFHGTRKRHPMFQNIIIKIFICLLVGFTFGFTLEKSKVYQPVQIRGQFIFSRLSYVKFHLAELSMGIFGLSLLAMIPATHVIFQRVCNNYFAHLSEKGISSAVLGGLLLGSGMALAGGGATLLLGQVGSMVPNSLYTLGGALLGSLLYGLIKPNVDVLTGPMAKTSSNPWAESAYFITAMPLVAMFGMSVFAIELLIPWQNEVKARNLVGDFLTRGAWPPHLSGAIIGFLEVPLVLFLECYLGGSSSYCTMVSIFFVGPLKKLSPFLAKFRTGFQSWWQVFYVGAIIAGAYVSASTGNSLGAAKGVPMAHAFLGGAMMTFGARIAGGCETGHSVSGMAFLSIMSFVVTMCMYIGGIATAFMIRSVDHLTPNET